MKIDNGPRDDDQPDEVDVFGGHNLDVLAERTASGRKLKDGAAERGFYLDVPVPRLPPEPGRMAGTEVVASLPDQADGARIIVWHQVEGGWKREDREDDSLDTWRSIIATAVASDYKLAVQR